MKRKPAGPRRPKRYRKISEAQATVVALILQDAERKADRHDEHGQCEQAS
jgi:hypothetical protein